MNSTHLFLILVIDILFLISLARLISILFTYFINQVLFHWFSFFSFIVSTMIFAFFHLLLISLLLAFLFFTVENEILDLRSFIPNKSIWCYKCSSNYSLTAFSKFWYIFILFLFSLYHFLIFILITCLTNWLYRSILFSLQIYGIIFQICCFINF